MTATLVVLSKLYTHLPSILLSFLLAVVLALPPPPPPFLHLLPSHHHGVEQHLRHWQRALTAQQLVQMLPIIPALEQQRCAVWPELLSMCRKRDAWHLHTCQDFAYTGKSSVLFPPKWAQVGDARGKQVFSCGTHPCQLFPLQLLTCPPVLHKHHSPGCSAAQGTQLWEAALSTSAAS